MNLKAQVFIVMALLHGAITSVVPTSSIETASQTVSDHNSLEMHVSQDDAEVNLHSNILIARQNYDNVASPSAVESEEQPGGFNFMGHSMPGGMKMPAMAMPGDMKIPSIPSPGGFKTPPVPFTGYKSSDTPTTGAKYPNMRYWKA